MEDSQQAILKDVFGESSDSECETQETTSNTKHDFELLFGEIPKWEAISSIKGLWVCKDFLDDHQQSLLLSNIHKDTYRSYLEHDANELQDFDSRERCLEKLKTVFNEVPTEVPTEDGIKYGELKKIFKDKWSLFKLLVQHEKFEYYRPLNAPPLARCATRLKGRSSNSSSTRFYWADDLLQVWF
ncbi:hypothetical protein AgCh_033001 [Apium graveolens]